MTSYVSADLRRLVQARANRVCEYCLIHEDDTYFGCQVEHIIAEKHGGPTEAENLAYACALCNRAKGTDIGTMTQGTRELVRFFNPRIDRWSEHFFLNGVFIQPQTAIGEATAKILRFNDTERLFECQMLERVERYPSEEAANNLDEAGA